MTWEQLAQEILKLPADVRFNEQSTVFMRQTGETAFIESVSKTKDWNGKDEPEFTLVYER